MTMRYYLYIKNKLYKNELKRKGRAVESIQSLERCKMVAYGQMA